MSSSLPYGIDSWFPVLRGGAAPSVFMDTRGPQAREQIRAAWKALPEGGRLVIQAVASPGSKPRVSHIEQDLEDEGYAERFVAFPGTGGSFTLLPTRDGAALRGGMPLLPSGRARGRALWALLRATSPFGIAQRLGRPEISVWTKGPSTGDPSDRADDLAVLPVAGSVAVAGGVPDRNQKIIVRALDRRGSARAILKIGFSERTDDAVAREALALEEIAEVLEDRAPKLLDQGQRADRTWLAQEVLEGAHAGDELTPSHASLLEELAQSSRSEARLEDLPFFQDSLRNLCSLDPAFDPDWHQEYAALIEALESAVGGEALPTTIAHGDFTPWNVLAKRGHLRAFDWEYFAREAPALYDVFHFHIQTGILVKRHTGERIFDGLDGFFRGPARTVAAAAGIREEEVLLLAGLYILHEGISAEIQERRSPSPYAQASWLRHARRALCRRLAGLIAERRVPSWAIEAVKPPQRLAA